MAQQIADRYNISRQLKVYEDGSIDTNTLYDGSPVSSTNRLPVDANFSGSVTLGAVEIKSGDSALTADVTYDGIANNRLMVDAGTLTVGSIYTVPPNTVTSSFVGNQTDQTLVTPTSGKKIQVIGVLLTSDDSLFTATIEFLTSGKVVQSHFEQGTLGAYIPTNVTGTTDEVLSLNISDSAAQNWFVQVNYAEVD
jgi:hypothetical protein